MALFVSVALFKRNDQLTYRPPRKETSDQETQARKSAVRYWNNVIQAPDKLMKIMVLKKSGIDTVSISEKSPQRPRDWLVHTMTIADALKQPHIAAAISELGIDVDATVPPLPDTLEINGAVYVRQI